MLEETIHRCAIFYDDFSHQIMKFDLMCIKEE